MSTGTVTEQSRALAQAAIARCRLLAGDTEEPGFTTRRFLSEPMHAAHARLRTWMEHAGMTVFVDPAGNLRGFYPASSGPANSGKARRLIVGSHLDTVPHGG